MSNIISSLVSCINKVIKIIEREEKEISRKIIFITRSFVDSRWGSIMLCTACISGPVVLFPTFWTAITLNHDSLSALRTLTWPIASVVNPFIYISLCHNGDSCLRMGMIVTTIMVWIIALRVWVF